MDIQTEHMKYRCYFISAVCGISLYSWYNYSLFDPINNSYLTVYYQNGIFVLFYLGWDTYHMITNPILFRTDLLIHHILSSFSCISLINYNALQTSNILIMECISLMNYVWRNNPTILKLYRTICIFGVRMPLSLWFFFNYNPQRFLPYVKINYTNYEYIYFKTLSYTFVFYILYDILILWKIYKPIKHKK
jgi:hypothetical protein